MPFLEVIYENGEHSIVNDDDGNAINGIKEQHRRATQGEPGGPAGQQAVRIKRVLRYDEHPGSLYESQAVSQNELKKWLDDAIKEHSVGDLVSVPEVIASLRNGVDPLVVSGPHESNYKAKEAEELDSELWEVSS